MAKRVTTELLTDVSVVVIATDHNCLSIMNIHGARRAWRRRRKACRLWTGDGPQRAYSGRGGGILCRHAHSLLLLLLVVVVVVVGRGGGGGVTGLWMNIGACVALL